MSDRSDPQWPFAGNVYETPRGPIQTYTSAANDRIDAVRRMTDREPLAAIEKRLAAGVLLEVRTIDEALAMLHTVEDKLIRFSKEEVKHAVLTQQVAIELEAHGLKEAA